MSIGFSVSHLCTYLPGCDNWAHSQQLLNSAFRSDQGGIYLSPTLQLGQSPREKFNQISKISTANNSNDLKTNRYLFYVCSRVLNFQLQFLIFFRKKKPIFFTVVLFFVQTKCFICPNSYNVRICSEYTHIVEWLVMDQNSVYTKFWEFSKSDIDPAYL